MGKENDVFVELMNTINNALDENEFDFEGVWKDPAKEEQFNSIVDCAKKLKQIEAVDEIVICDEPDIPDADVSIIVEPPAFFYGRDNGINWFKKAVASSDMVVFTESTSGKIKIRFVVENYWHEDLSKK